MLKFAKKISFLFLCFTLQIFSEEALKVGMELTYPPFEMIDKEGLPAGISVEIAQAFGSYLKRNVKIENISFVGLIPSLKSCKIDIIISSMSITKERRKAIDFTEPYLKIGLCLLVGINSTITCIEDLDQSHHIICVKQGTTGQIYAQTRLKKASILILDKESACVTEVVQGKANAFIYDQLSIYKNWQKNITTTKAILKPFAVEFWAAGIRKDDQKLKGEFNDFIIEFRRSGQLKQLQDKYLGEQQEAFQKMGIELYL